ncbi:uncharacterized protein LOC132715167 [Ruditapes philippinarum]|uniref:uncharacterized protein LOC132715167 n=1 Tax=Ruditapes philippinarum TaxID=129788 RepID=UPI00295B922E|nr:uncharacterized protein LOC132715167 [Ruditapes philippinarum]
MTSSSLSSSWIFVSVFSIFAHIYGRIEGTVSDDVTCVMTYQNWISPTSLTVNWALPRQAPKREQMDINITWYSFNVGSCPEMELTSCTWNYGSGMSFNENFRLSVIIIEKKTKHMVFNKEWEVNPDDCLKAPSVDKVLLEAINSTCINMTWWYEERSKCSDFDDKYYQISYRKNDTESVMVVNHGNITIETSCNTSRIVCDLHPYTTYIFNVQTKFCDWQKMIRGHYSDGTFSMFTTPEDVPAGVPGVTTGCFSEVQNKCTDENIRVIRIYWKDVSSDLKQGIITHFMLDIFINTTTSNRHVTSLSVPGDNYNNLATLTCDSGYDIRLRAATSVGASSLYSSLFIPQFNEGNEDIIQDVVPVIANNSFLVYWLMNPQTGINRSSDLRVFWCYKDVTNRCMSPINWTNISEESSFGYVLNQDGPVPRRYRFGIGHVETGIKWSKCLYTQAEDLRPPVGLRLESHKSSPPGSIVIYWDNLPCESQPPRPYINQFIITICKVKLNNLCQDKAVVKYVTGERNNIRISDLDSSVSYMVCVQSEGLFMDHRGQNSCIIGKPAGAKRNHSSLIVVVVASSCIVVCFICVICGIVKVKNKMKKFPITVPEFIDNDQDINSRRSIFENDYSVHELSSTTSSDTGYIHLLS